MTQLVNLSEAAWGKVEYSNNRYALETYLDWLEDLEYKTPKTIKSTMLSYNGQDWPALELDGELFRLTKMGFESILNRYGLRSRGFMKYLAFKDFMGAVGYALQRAQTKFNPSRFAVSGSDLLASYSEHYQKDEPRESIEFLEKWFASYSKAGLFFSEFWKEDKLFRVFWDIHLLDEDLQLPEAEGIKGDLCLVYESSSFGFAAEKLFIALRRKNSYLVIRDVSKQVHKGDFGLDNVISAMAEKLVSDFIDIKRMFLKLDRLILKDPEKARKKAYELGCLTEESKKRVTGKTNFYLLQKKQLTAGMLLRFMTDEIIEKKLTKRKETKWASDIFQTLLLGLKNAEEDFGEIEELIL